MAKRMKIKQMAEDVLLHSLNKWGLVLLHPSLGRTLSLSHAQGRAYYQRVHVQQQTAYIQDLKVVNVVDFDPYPVMPE